MIASLRHINAAQLHQRIQNNLEESTCCQQLLDQHLQRLRPDYLEQVVSSRRLWDGVVGSWWEPLPLPLWARLRSGGGSDDELQEWFFRSASHKPVFGLPDDCRRGLCGCLQQALDRGVMVGRIAKSCSSHGACTY